MKLIKIDILKYKSIKNPFSIVFEEGKVVALIGKNGSGKTNVLEAIKYAFSENQHFTNGKNECKIQYHIELSDEEMEDYFSCVDTNKMAKEIIVDFDNVIGRRYIESSAIFIEAKNFKSRLESVLKGFKTAAQNYIDALKNFEMNNFNRYYTANVRIETDEGGSFTYLENNRLMYYERSLHQQKEIIINFMQEIFDGNRILLNKYEVSNRLLDRVWHVPFYKIAENEQMHISPIVASSLKISKKDLDDANVRLNEKLKELNKVLKAEYLEIQSQLDEFDKIKNEIHSIFDSKWDEWDESNKKIDENYKSLIQKLKDMVFTNCYYLDNENTLLFSQSNRQEYNIDRQKQFHFLNSHNPIIEALNSFLYHKGVLDENTNLVDIKKMTKMQLNKMIKLINNEFLPSIVPKFDDNEIEKFAVDFDNGSLNLYVHEKSGDVVSFNDTSLGRRWYLTYQFIKMLLKSGDILFIDEPAAFLHTQAQIEFKSELNDLAKRGVYVLYSTHSPYLIPDDWGQVYNVTMSESGTQIYKFESGDDLCAVIREELGVTNTASILFNLEKTLLLVEGVSDMVCIEKFAELLDYDISAYKILPCNGSPIFDVTYLCIQQGIKFKALFDLDNKCKPEKWMNRKYGYNEYIKIFETNDNCVFTPAIRNNKSLEDCFHDNDNTKYFFEYKWTDKNGIEKKERKIDKDKIQRATDFEDETKKNFEQLFNNLGMPKLDELNS